jgi:hypothetical protein
VNGTIKGARVLGVDYNDLVNIPANNSSQWTTSGTNISYTGSVTVGGKLQVNSDGIYDNGYQILQTINDDTWLRFAQGARTNGIACYNGISINGGGFNCGNWNSPNALGNGNGNFTGSLTASEVYTNNWFRNNNADGGLYNQVRGAHFAANNTAYGNWKIWGNQQGGWSGINFSDQSVSLMMNDNYQGFHRNQGSGWSMYHLWGSGIWSQAYGWLHDRFADKVADFNAVGSYALAGYIIPSNNVAGNIVSGSNLRQANTYHNGGDAGWRDVSMLSGTWRFMGAIGYYINSSGGYGASTSRNTQTTLFVRIS